MREELVGEEATEADEIPAHPCPADAGDISSLVISSLVISSLVIASLPPAAKTARDFVGSTCTRWTLDPSVVDVARTVASELVTNAHRHGSTQGGDIVARGTRQPPGTASPALHVRRGHPAGGRPRRPSLVDIAPTIAELLGARPPAQAHGRVLTEAWRQRPPEDPQRAEGAWPSPGVTRLTLTL